MATLICSATNIEAHACREGILSSGNHLEVLQTGVGFRHAKNSLTSYLKKNKKPSLLVSTGFAGALSRDIPIHSWVTATKILKDHSELDPRGLVRAPSFAIKSALITTPHLTRQDGKSEQLVKSIGTPLAVDMESAVLYEICLEHEIPFMALRLITDTPDCPLPAFISTWTEVLSQDGFSNKFSLGLKGLQQTFSDVGGVFRLVGSGSRWPEMLKTGWATHCAFLDVAQNGDYAGASVASTLAT
jgi:nucleoside phosphorylase